MFQRPRDPISRACHELFSSVPITKTLVWDSPKPHPSVLLTLSVSFTVHVELHLKSSFAFNFDYFNIIFRCIDCGIYYMTFPLVSY